MKKIPSGAVLRFVERLEREGVCMHAFELCANGEIEAEAYYAPFAKGQPHRMYSVSKSMVSIAVGMLEAEGRLSLQERIIDRFPDKIDHEPDPRLVRLTIRDMLRMATCHEKTAYREGIDHNWARGFFNVQPTHEPGTVFFYDTGSTQVLCELCERITGKSMLAFLKERLFEPLGATDEKRWLTDPSGVCQGGTGLIMSLRDLGKVARCVMEGGNNLAPESYLRAATSKQIDTSWQQNPEERYGYGYQFWQTRHGYCMYGMGGQLAVMCPQEGVLLCTLADTRLDAYGLQKLYDAFFEEILPHVGEPDDAYAREALVRRLGTLRVASVSHAAHISPPHPARYAMQKNSVGLESVAIGDNAVTLAFSDASYHLCWSRFAVAEQSLFPGTQVPCLTSAGMTESGALHVRCQLIGDAPCGLELLIAQKGGTLTLRMKKSSDPLTNRFEGLFYGEEMGRAHA